VRVKRVWAIVVAGLLALSLIPILPELVLAAGPEISNVQAPDISFASVTITWTTNTTSNSRVNYGTDRPKDATWGSAQDASAVTYHSIHLEGLAADETYYFEVVSADGSGTATDSNGGEYYSFKTLAWYSISLNPIAGSCGGEEITVTATVATDGIYRICWDSLTNDRVTFTASTAGIYYPEFNVPEAVKGDHTVYLVDSTGAKKAEASFEIVPSVQIDPDEGPVGTVVTLSGCGFGASQSIQVKFEDASIQTTQTTSSGSWPTTITYTIPDTPGGDYDFVVEVNGVAWTSESFEVTPEITAPSSGTAGHTIQVEGTGFQSNERNIKITFDGKVVQTNTPIVASDKGRWTATIGVPLVQRGTHTIDASGDKTSASNVPGIEDFVVGAGILVETPGPYHVDDPITIAGGGFAAGETGIKVTFGGQTIYSGIKAKQDGTWEYPFDLPPTAYGTHDVAASGDITTPVTASLSVQSRILQINPKSGAPGDLVSLTGDGFGSNQQPTVTLGGLPASGNIQPSLSNGNLVISFRVPKDVVEGTGILAVTDGSGASASDEFTVTKKILSTTPLPVSPRNGSTLRSRVVTFRWQGVPNGTDFTYTYTLELSRTAGGGSFWSLNNISASNYTWSEDDPLENGTYYWRVKMTDNYGNESPWSDSSSFNVSPIPTWVWVVIGLVVLIVLMVVAYRETKFRVTE
jgi:hypothetical protein